MKITEEELNSYRTAVWNLLYSLEQGWTNYKQNMHELKQVDKRLFDNTNITSAMHSDGQSRDVCPECKTMLSPGCKTCAKFF